MKFKEIAALVFSAVFVFGLSLCAAFAFAGRDDTAVTSEPTESVVPVVHVHVPTPAPTPVSVVETEAPAPAAPVTTVSVASMMRRMHRTTRVTSAPSFYPGYDSTDPEVRRAFGQMYSPTWPEANNLRRDQELFDTTVLVFSRLCVSEANWIHNPCESGEVACDPGPDHNRAELDCPAIYRVIRRTRARGETLMGALRRHTHYVTEQWEPRAPRTRWIVNLNLENTSPANFPAGLNWERDYRPRWLAVQALTRRLFAGHDLGPYAAAPLIAWGGRCEDVHGACDDHIAEARGLVPFETGDTANRFWCRPGTEGCIVPAPIAEATVSPEATTVEPVEAPVSAPVVEAFGEPPVAAEPVLDGLVNTSG